MSNAHLSDEERRAKKAKYEAGWRKANPEKNKLYRRAYYAKNREKVQQQGRESYYRNVDLTRDRKRLWRQGRKEEAKAKLAAVRAANPNYYKEKHKKDRKTYRARLHFGSIKHSAKTSGVECSLTIEWFQERLASGICEMTGLPFDMTQKRGRNTPSVDRRDPSGPYSPENCRMVLWSLNHALSNHGEDYMIDIFKRIIERRG